MILGIDTSCYTTSVALVSEEKTLLADERLLIPVEHGCCGVKQSEAVFSHVKQLPQCLNQLWKNFNGAGLTGICASVQPRPLAASYMPVFCVGKSLGESLAAVLSLPFYETTHQEGHLMSALWSAAVELDDFLAIHLSGGTTELLRVKRLKAGFEIQLLGTSDLAAGQMVDRVGVALGLPFPAGPALEKLASEVEKTEIKLPISVRGLDVSFSGPESQAQRLLKAGAAPDELATAVFELIAESLVRLILNAKAETGVKDVLLAGGVAANLRIKATLEYRLDREVKLAFAAPEYSGDNAVGVALLGLAKQRVDKIHGRD